MVKNKKLIFGIIVFLIILWLNVFIVQGNTCTVTHGASLTLAEQACSDTCTNSGGTKTNCIASNCASSVFFPGFCDCCYDTFIIPPAGSIGVADGQNTCTDLGGSSQTSSSACPSGQAIQYCMITSGTCVWQDGYAGFGCYVSQCVPNPGTDVSVGTGDREDEADSITVLITIDGRTAASKTCTKQETCTLSGVSQQECCWATGSCLGGGWVGIYGSYVATAASSCWGGDDFSGSSIAGPNNGQFACLAEGSVCTTDDECVKLPGSPQGFCTVGSSNGMTSYCRPTDPYCGDHFCDGGAIVPEICSGATRLTDIDSCNDDSPSTICQYYTCDGGCDKKYLPANDYPDTDYWPKYIEPQDAWSCNYATCTHCSGNSSGCVSSCDDKDIDGYGKAYGLFHSDCCGANSLIVDCNDNPRTNLTIYGGDPFYIHPADKPNTSLVSYIPSQYCDCDPSDGYTQGINESYLPAVSVSIATDRCYDGVDNDCDGPNDPTNLGKVDCFDPGCLKPNASRVGIYAIRNRSCAGDCNSLYNTETNFDRACCLNATDCVINEKCVASGVMDGTFPNKYMCAINRWYGGDMDRAFCNAIVNDTNYSTTNFSHFGLSGNAGNGSCCGDDMNEYFTKGLYGDYACCNQPGMQVVGGNCVTTLTNKYTWDNSGSGYCLSDSQCLVNPNIYSFTATVANASDINRPTNNMVRCINDTEFIGDHLCYNGEWTTRTAAVAIQLGSYANVFSDFSLYCDNYTNVLNNYDYSISDNYAENYLGLQSYLCKLRNTSIPCTNNLCVLKYNDGSGEKVVIGTSLNQNVNANTYSILEAFGGTNADCNSVLSSTSFSSCGTGVFYNNKIKSVIYSKNSMSLENVLAQQWLNSIRSLYSPLTNYVGSQTISSYDFSFARDTHNFNNVYFQKKGSKSITLLGEEINGKKYLSAFYKGFGFDVCSLVNNYKSTLSANTIPFDCRTQGSDYYVITGGASGYYRLLDDLGPKLRLG